MADVVDPATRSRMMSGIRGKNTRPEMLVRRHLHARGFRYRLHVKTLPGKPDIVLPRYRAVILIHGCFWHGHDCQLFKWPSTRQEFWCAKIGRNRKKDAETLVELEAIGWRVLSVWECAIKGRQRLSVEDLIERISSWIVSGSSQDVIRGG
ncbi:very short patch repair endonuclease [Desulfuromonas soudanensis]|uniref:very short patch repair endonuclease n=1 Tax=Desulfuromonas soudanensis TaxID=1603606 RepID=UPI0009EA6E79